jgi:hypothetical protein
LSIGVWNCSDSKTKKLKNTEGGIIKGKSRETGNIGYTRRRKTKQKHNTTQHNTICVGDYYTQTNTNKVINFNFFVLLSEQFQTPIDKS